MQRTKLIFLVTVLIFSLKPGWGTQESSKPRSKPLKGHRASHNDKLRNFTIHLFSNIPLDNFSCFRV